MIRTWALTAVFVGVAASAWPVQRVSVGQLERILAEAQSSSDVDLAARLSDFRLTERLDSARLTRWRASLSGARSRRALLGMADRSAFLDLPAAEIPAKASPDIAEQRRILGLAANYVNKAIPQLPRFYATRSTVYFEDVPGSATEAEPTEGSSLHAVRISRTTVQYRDGQEIVEPGLVKVGKARTVEKGLKTWGAFGPVLGLVLVDAAQNKMAWGHWEQGTGGSVAVFRYSVPKEKSHYEVRYCCVASAYGMESNSFQQMSGYHGEIAVDPASGTIVRLTLEAELDRDAPIARADLTVEYAPMELGGATYICPTRSVSISMARTIRQMQDPSGHSWPTMGPMQMLLNHVDFEQYHLFRAETRILSGREERTAGLAPDATLPSASPADLPPSEEELADAPAPMPTLAAPAAATAGFSAITSPGGDAPEISTAEATGLPESPLHPPEQSAGAQPSGPTFRISARLVDLNVVALDKKGRPVTDLKPEDFEVYDNGLKQKVSSFNQADSGSGNPPATPAALPVKAEDSPAFSNRAAKDARPEVAGGNTIVVMIDSSNLSFNDLIDARRQVVNFLQAMPSGQPVALYAMRYHGFQVLEEATSDHSLIAERLAKWTPSPQDVANANDEEQRNRQQIETVHSPEDMLNVNGNFSAEPDNQGDALDPKLRELGSNPGPNALSILVDVAHHLAPFGGHKSLVWVTSDNALADWNRLSVTVEKHSKYIEPIALRTQEAMNNAHVSVYPLDASRLEAAVINADVGRRNVELTPTYQRPQSLEHELEGPEATAGQDMNAYIQNRNFGAGGRLSAQMQQDLHPIQGVFREVAEATGGRALRRTSNILGELNGVVVDGRATYVLGFSPSQQADGQYHVLTVKLAKRRDVMLRYRTGYQYDKEPATLKARFAQTVWQPVDAGEIGISTRPIADAAGNALRVTVAGTDLDLAQQNALWTGKLDIFLVQRDAAGQHAKVTGQTVGLRLKQPTYHRAISEGLTFDERIDSKPAGGSLRVVVVDVNSGRMGSVTVPVAALEVKP